MKTSEVAKLVELIKKGKRVNSTALLEVVKEFEDTEAMLILKLAIMAYDAVQNGLLVQAIVTK